jgi:glycine cleavage system aminomethyltransferase T
MADAELMQLLASGKAFVDLSSWRKVGVSSRDPISWLNGLLSANVDDLAPGRARHALLLSEGGGVRAEITVTVPGGSVVLIQDPAQPHPIDELLAPHTEGSDVELDDRTEELALFAFPGRSREPEAPGSAYSTPSCLGTGGVDVLSLAEDHDRLLGQFGKQNRLAEGEDVEAWRIAAGIPRVGIDTLADDLPRECGLEWAVSYGKGPYPGREAVNDETGAGRPRTVLVPLETDGPVSPGDTVEANGSQTGRITSVASLGGRCLVLARIAWERLEGPFHTSGGIELRPRSPGGPGPA